MNNEYKIRIIEFFTLLIISKGKNCNARNIKLFEISFQNYIN